MSLEKSEQQSDPGGKEVSRERLPGGSERSRYMFQDGRSRLMRWQSVAPGFNFYEEIFTDPEGNLLSRETGVEQVDGSRNIGEYIDYSVLGGGSLDDVMQGWGDSIRVAQENFSASSVQEAKPTKGGLHH